MEKMTKEKAKRNNKVGVKIFIFNTRRGGDGISPKCINF
jgi:hypothetical protein